MAKLRKRIHNNKKKIVKRLIKHTQAKHKTAEQQAKENDMMKTILSRQMIASPITQTYKDNDKIQQQIETYNKTLNEAKKRNEGLESELSRMKQQYQEEKEREDKIKTGQKELKRMKSQDATNARLEEAEEELQNKLDEYDLSTIAGQAKKRIDDIQNEIKGLDKELNDAKKTEAKDEIYKAVKKAEDERKAVEIQLAAYNELFKSDKWLKRRDRLIETTKDLALKKRALEEQQLIAKKKEEIMYNEAETEAQKQYLAELDKGRPRVVMNRDGTPKKSTNGKGDYVYEKDGSGNVILYKEDSINNQRKRNMAEVDAKLIKARNRASKYRAKIENVQNMMMDFNKKDIELKNLQDEIDRDKTYIESKEFLDMEKEAAENKEKLNQQQRLIEIERAKNEQSKKIRSIMVAQQVAQDYADGEINSAGILTQIQEAGDYGAQLATEELKEIQNGIALKHARDKLKETFDGFINKYDGENRTHAETNLLQLIANKTGEKLKENIYDNDLYHTQRMKDFIDFVGQYDESLIYNPDSLDAFINDDAYKKFEWKNV